MKRGFKMKMGKAVLVAMLGSCLMANHALAAGWLQDQQGAWYYFDGNGYLHTGWLDINGSRYYLDMSGRMVTGRQIIDGVSYDFDPINGNLLQNPLYTGGAPAAQDWSGMPGGTLATWQIYGIYECHTDYLDAELEVGVYTGDGTEYIRLTGSSTDGMGAGEFEGIVVHSKENNYVALDEYENVIQVYFDMLGNATVTDGNTGLGGMYFPGFDGIYRMTADSANAG